ncbi:GFA family protein [Corallincola holothuriorum]|uniref:GFA family protein n=1 Tax=Corallincola holothuriorum TaxID=2282215 RepID=A0A368N6M9_9GAMM|nr:GFA family protein [Corallincola holothuriorum]RCU45221.1 GFA family protein [Corallincola holothuriorum]
MSSKGITGQCLCGDIKLVVATPPDHFEACHCDMCRRWGGGAFLAFDGGCDVVVTGTPSVYDSSEWAERGFCGSCGSHLFYRIKQNQQYMLPMGLFPELKQTPFTQEIFIDEKPSYYGFANETKKMTGEEAFAAFAAQGRENEE